MSRKTVKQARAKALREGKLDKDPATVTETVVTEPTEAPAEETRRETETDPLDVNKDGVVDAKDVAEVANAAAASEEEE